jgi:hypothetical protein
VAQGLSLSGSDLDDGTTSCGEGGVPCRTVVPPSGVHRDYYNLETSSRAVVRVYNSTIQQAGDSGALDQRRQAGGEDEAAALLPSVPLEPSAAGTEPAGLKPGQSLASAGVAPRNRELVADESAAMAGEEWRTDGKTCVLLLVIAGGMTSDAKAVRGDARSDRSAPDADRIESWRSSQQRDSGNRRCCKSGGIWAIFGGAGADSRTAGGAPDGNRLTMSRTGEMGIHL